MKLRAGAKLRVELGLAREKNFRIVGDSATSCFLFAMANLLRLV